MNFDDRIKAELEQEAEQLDRVMLEEPGLFSMMMATFKGGLRRWAVIVNVGVIVISLVMVWLAIQFFNALTVSDQVFWGICLILSLQVQIGGKQWFYNEVGRSHLVREMKRIEITIESLGKKIGTFSK